MPVITSDRNWEGFRQPEFLIPCSTLEGIPRAAPSVHSLVTLSHWVHDGSTQMPLLQAIHAFMACEGGKARVTFEWPLSHKPVEL